MSTEENMKRLEQAVRRWNAGDLDGYLALYDANVLLQGYAGVQPGLAGVRHFYEAFWAAFPGSRLTLEDVFASGEKVACRFVIHAEHRGPFQGIPATGAHVTMPGLTILQFRDDRCIRRWSYTDAVGLLQQLGALPRPQAGDPTKA